MWLNRKMCNYKQGYYNYPPQVSINYNATFHLCLFTEFYKAAIHKYKD